MVNANILKQYDDAWLNLGDLSKLHVTNDLMHDLRLETLGLDALRFMRKPANFALTAKVLFNIDVLPIQAAILEELWNRPFPMYIASRGFGKAIPPDTPLRIKNGWMPIKHIQVGDMVYGGDGKLTKVTGTTYRQTNLNMYRITLRDGRQIECCEDHMWRVWDKHKNNNKSCNKWSECTTKEMVNNYFTVRKNSKSKIPNAKCKEYRYALPINKPLIDEDKKEFILHPYVLGVLLGNGRITTNSIGITTKDQHLIDRVNEFLPDGYILKKWNGISYGIIREDKTLPPFWHLLKSLGVFGHGSHTKYIPEKYKYGSYEQKLELIRGLMDADGYSKKSVVKYCTVSNRLSDDFLDVARSLGLHCKHSTKESWFKGDRYADCHCISIYTKEPIFTLPRKLGCIKHEISKQGRSKYDKVFITNIEYIGKMDGYCITVDNDDHTYITKDYIVTHNSYMLALYAMLKLFLVPETKVVIVGAAFRQAKVIFEYMETIWRNADIARSVVSGDSGPRRDIDRCTMRVNDSWAIAIPLGNGDKIRGLRAHTILADEFSSIPPDIYETVVAGFAAVSADPITNVKEAARRQAMVKAGIWTVAAEQKYKSKIGNQAILSGTAGYGFQHFANYWRRYKAIIQSRGDIKKLREMFDIDELPESFNWRDYSVIRIPYELVPPGFMDDRQIMRAKATVHSAIYAMEYGAVFSDDSDGFFKRSLIEECVANYKNLQKSTWPKEWCPNEFDALIRGSSTREYVFGVDPASEQDNFSIIILELWPGHSRIVYSWTTTRKDFKQRLKAGLTKEHDFYGFCARKIRDLMKVFPCKAIAMDAQGGGIAIEEALHDPEKLEPNEKPIWPVIEDDKEKETDIEAGSHILHLCQFAKADWTAEANHGLRKDFEDRILLFPRFDPVTLELSIEEDKRRKTAFESANPDKKFNIYDTLEDCVLELEELKDELSTITMTRTGTGVNSRDRWDTPEIKLTNGKKGRMRKDRYSALVMANMVARTIQRMPQGPDYAVIGGAVGTMSPGQKGQMYLGPEWFVSSMDDGVVYGVSRR